jgi:predicted ATPase
VLQGWTRVLEGDRERGLEQLRAGVSAWDATGAQTMRAWHACLLAGGLLACGESYEGLAAIDAGLVAIEGGERWCEPELHRLRAELLRASGETDRATGCAQQALVCARRMYAPAWERRAAQTLAGLAGMPRAA